MRASRSVTISLTEPGSNYAYTLQASPRSQSGVALLSLGNASVQNGATITVDGNVDVNGTITDPGAPPGLTATGGKHQNTNVTDVVAAGLPDQVTTFPPNIVPSCSFPSGTFTLAAGTYNCQLVVGPTATVTLSPGVYQLNDGISVSGTLNYTTNPSSQGEGVLLYLPCSGPCNEGAFIAPGASVTLPPLTAAQSVTASTSATINPKTPALQDMWFWQAGGDSSEDDLIGNGQGGQTSGIFYAPSATADLSSSSGSDATGDIIAQTVITSASTADDHHRKMRRFSLRRSNCSHSGDRSRDAGDTLVEIMIAVVIIGIAVAGILGGLAAVLGSSGTHRSLTSLDAIVKGFAETAKYDIQEQPAAQGGPKFVACALTSSYVVASVPYPSSGPNGTWVTVFGSGFVAGTTASVTIGGQPPGPGTPPSVVAPNGDVNLTFLVPPLPAGPHPIEITDGSISASAAAAFIVTPLIILDHASGPAGTPVTATLTGFRANTGVTLTFGGTPVKSGVTEPVGRATLSFNALATAA